MFYFTEADVQELLPVTECIRLMRLTLEALAEGRAQNQPRRRLILESGSVLHSMAGAFINYFGTKFYFTNPRSRAPFPFFLSHRQTALPRPTMKANNPRPIPPPAPNPPTPPLPAHPDSPPR